MAVASSATTAAPTQQRGRSKGIPEGRLAKMMGTPSLVLIAIVGAWPIIYAIWLSLHQYGVRDAGLSRWSGLDNYTTALGDSDWPSALFHTIVFTVSSVFFETV